MTTTFDRLRTILVRDYKADPAALTPGTPLESLEIDSLGIAELLFTVEDEFDVKVTKEPLQLDTVADVVAYIDGLVATRVNGGPAAAGPGLQATDP